MIPYAAPFARRAVTGPSLVRLIRELAAEVDAGTVHHEEPGIPQCDEEYTVGLAWLREPQPRLFP